MITPVWFRYQSWKIIPRHCPVCYWPFAFCSLLVGFAILESVRWAWIQQYLQRNLDDDDDNTATTTRPWWYRRRTTTNADGSNLQESLLPFNNDRPHWSSNNSTNYLMDDGVGSPRRGWWPFSSSPNNVRDDGSVDYASLNEDWASRSEENPHWWAQEGGGGA